MPPLYVVQQNSKLRINNRRLRVEKDNEDGVEVLASVPLGQLEQVVLFGNISLTTPAIDALLAQNSDVVFLTQNGEYRGRLVGEVTPHVPLRRAQYERLSQADFALRTAKGIANAKLVHQRAILARHNRDLKDETIDSVLAELSKAISAVERKESLSSLRGLEGAATAAYFEGYRRLFDDRWRFVNRNRRPPADPVNVLLSFGYTLLAQASSGAVQAVGLDPYFGTLHEVVYNRPSLGLDVMEEFRPVVDGVVLWACRSGQVSLEDFENGGAERPILLKDQGKRRFVEAYEQRMAQSFTHPIRKEKLPLRQCVVEQARQIARRIQANDPGYQGMGFR